MHMSDVSVDVNETFVACHNPNRPTLVFDHVFHGMDVLECTVNLLCVLRVVELENAYSRCSCPHLTVSSFHETCDIRVDLLSVESGDRDVVELATIVGLECSPHTHVEESVVVLLDAVDIVAGHSALLLILFLENAELVAVVFIESVSCSRPDESIVVEIHLTGEAA